MKVIPAYFAKQGVNSYTDEGHQRKEKFHRDGKKVLKQLALEIGLPEGTYEIRSNKAGIAVSGEVTLHADHLYVQMYESCIGSGGIEIMYRSCGSQKDYCGDNNNFLKNVRDLNDPARRAAFVAACRRLISKYNADFAVETVE
jgi:hypothetical protein